MRIVLSLTALLLFETISFSQNASSLRGTVFDTSGRQPVANATISLVKSNDSSLVSFTMTRGDGRFDFSGLAAGDFTLLVTHVAFHSSTLPVKLDGRRAVVLDTIVLTDKAKVLSGVTVVSDAPPVTLIDDTVQYNAGSFKTQPNASVEDLLKRLPGIKVEKDGSVKAQGEKVQKVLVDGKEFFGDDPKIATKNLPADAVDKVQVYDKLSDQAQMTGFDDGNSERTINLKLKKDKKKGGFGKAMAGGGTDERFQGKLNVNSFKGARQMSIIGVGNNSNADGFSFIDALNFSGAMNKLKNGGGAINISISDNDPIVGLLGNSNTGINTIFGGGMNYNNIIGTKTDFRSNYFFSHYNPRRETEATREYLSPANIYNSHTTSDNNNNSHKVNLNIDQQIDSFNSIKFSPSFTYQQTNNRTGSTYQTASKTGIPINDGSTTNNAAVEAADFSGSLLYRHKFHRKGRTFSLNLFTTINNNSGNGALQSLTNFYDSAGRRASGDTVNQHYATSAALHGYNIKAVYTEPLFRYSLLEFSASKSNTYNHAEKETYDFNTRSSKYDLVNPLLTNDFTNTYDFENGGIRLRKQTKRFNYSAGIAWQHATLEGKTLNTAKDSGIQREFYNLLPAARFQYNFSRYKNIRLDYTTSTNQPSVSQLQPVADNSNPLFVHVGNTSLKQEFTHTLRLNTALVTPFRNRNFFATLTFQQTQNKIVDFDRINPAGIDSIMPVNVNGVYNLNGNLSWGFPVHFLKGSMELGTNGGFNSGKQLLSDSSFAAVTNEIRTLSVGPLIRFNLSPTEKLNLSLSAELSFSRSVFSIQSDRDSRFLDQDYSTDISWELPAGFQLATDFDLTVNGRHAAGYNATVPLWNASVSKTLLPFNRGELKFQVRDLLDQNLRVNRSITQNYIEDTKITGLRRFFMLSFTYNLNKNALQKEGGPIRLR